MLRGPNRERLAFGKSRNLLGNAKRFLVAGMDAGEMPRTMRCRWRSRGTSHRRDPRSCFIHTWYDGAGNLTQTNASGLTTNNTFDSLNRLVLVQPATGADVTFLYDPDGRRVQKESSAEYVRFVYDGEKLLVENDSTNTPQTEYTQGDSGASANGGYGNLVSQFDEGTSSSYQFGFDALGSTGALIDSSGAAADRWEYSASGLQNSAPMGEPTIHIRRPERLPIRPGTRPLLLPQPLLRPGHRQMD